MLALIRGVDQDGNGTQLTGRGRGPPPLLLYINIIWACGSAAALESCGDDPSFIFYQRLAVCEMVAFRLFNKVEEGEREGRFVCKGNSRDEHL